MSANYILCAPQQVTHRSLLGLSSAQLAQLSKLKQRENTNKFQTQWGGTAKYEDLGLQTRSFLCQLDRMAKA